MHAAPAHSIPSSRWRHLSPLAMQQIVLLILLAIGCTVFPLLEPRFLGQRNVMETLRLTVMVGLLAVALTPVIITGGIDLSVGSVMGLSAVLMDRLWREAHLPFSAALAIGIGTGIVAGGINGLLVTRLKIPPLIVTLGTFSLYRGLAEALDAVSRKNTGQVITPAAYPAAFTQIGEGFFLGIPIQVLIFFGVVIAFWILLHRTVYGRSVFAIGFSEEGSRHAGLPVRARVLAAYVLCGAMSSLAAAIHVAHYGRPLADVGTWNELRAITAVVLGGTSIFGGRGGIPGTVLALLLLSVLRTGLPLVGVTDEMVDIVGGVLLIGSLVVNRLLVKWSAARVMG